MKCSDEELLAELNVDHDSLAEFYSRHIDRVLNYAIRRVRSPDDAADITQLVFMSVIDSAPTFDPQRGTAIGWLYGICHNTVSNWRRDQARTQTRTAQAGRHRLLNDDEYATVDDHIAAAALQPDLARALDRLPADQRQILELVSYDHLSVAHAAEALGISAASARMRLSRARRAMKASIHSRTATDSVGPDNTIQPDPCTTRSSAS